MKCPITDTAWSKKFPALKDLDGELRHRLELAFPMLRTLQKEIDCPEFMRMFGLGFWVGLLFFQAKETRRHQKDIDHLVMDIQDLEDMTGIKVSLLNTPADFWVKVPK